MKYTGIILFVLLNTAIYSQQLPECINSLKHFSPTTIANCAKEDLKNGKVHLLRYYSSLNLIELSNPQVDFDSVETIFEFEYVWGLLPISSDSIQQITTPYNEVVYNHLDSLFEYDSKLAIRTELTRLGVSRLEFNRSLGDIRKNVQNSFRNESKEIRHQIFQADSLYLSRQFELAIKSYGDLYSSNITPSTQDYMLCSLYHCFLQLDQRELAERFLMTNNISRVSKFNY